MIEHTALTLAVGVVAGLLAIRLKMPSGSILGPMIAVGALQILGLPLVTMGAEWRFAALMLVGTAVGTAFTRGAVALMLHTVRLSAIGVVLLIVAGLLGGLVLTRMTALPTMVAMLGMSPGGASEMAAIALDFQSDAGVVAALHMVRQVTVFLSFPLLFRVLIRSKRDDPPS